MNTVLKLAIGGGVLYYLYESGWLSSLSGGLLPAPAAASPVLSAGGAAASVVHPDTFTLVRQAAGLQPGALQTFDQWNFYYNKVRGIPGPDPSNFLDAAHRSQNLTDSEWWADMQQGGFSGMGEWQRLVRNPTYLPPGQPGGGGYNG